jgi:hypothetical protein
MWPAALRVKIIIVCRVQIAFFCRKNYSYSSVMFSNVLIGVRIARHYNDYITNSIKEWPKGASPNSSKQ